MKLTSLTDVKAFLEKTDSTHDSLIEIFINGMSPYFEVYTGRLFEKTERIKKFDAGTRYIFLPAYPVDLSVTFEIYYRGTKLVRGGVDSDYSISPDYFLEYETGIITFNNIYTPINPQDLEVTWTGGFGLISDSDSDDYGVLDVPDNLRLAATIQVSYMFKNRQNLGQSFVALPNGQIAMSNKFTLLPLVKEMLQKEKVSLI